MTSDGETPLSLALRWDALSVAQYLVGQGADMHAKANGGGTPLHGAAMRDAQSVVQYLVGQGADVNATDSHGWTAQTARTCIYGLFAGGGQILR